MRRTPRETVVGSWLEARRQASASFFCLLSAERYTNEKDRRSSPLTEHHQDGLCPAAKAGLAGVKECKACWDRWNGKADVLEDSVVSLIQRGRKRRTSSKKWCGGWDSDAQRMRGGGNGEANNRAIRGGNIEQGWKRARRRGERADATVMWRNRWDRLRQRVDDNAGRERETDSTRGWEPRLGRKLVRERGIEWKRGREKVGVKSRPTCWTVHKEGPTGSRNIGMVGRRRRRDVDGRTGQLSNQAERISGWGGTDM